MSELKQICRELLAVAVLMIACVSMGACPAHADEARIFVIREADGTIRFTNRPPADDQIAEVFTARSSSVSYYPASQQPSKRGGGVRRFHRNRFDEYIERAAEENSVDPALIKAVIHAESAFNPRAISPKGALGLMQLMPSTARMLGVNNAFAPESNILGGTRYLALQRHPAVL
jgi:soluble lytic murein transglycosylase-like protein